VKIFVCVKHVPDSAATIVVRDRNQIEEKITFLLNPYDEYAVTEAVRFKKLLGEAEIIALSLGTADAEKTVRSAMAMGADRGILIISDKREDSITTARALKSAIEQDGGELGIIFTGRESIDMVGMQTMFRLGASLNFPVVNNVVKFTPDMSGSRIQDGGDEDTHSDNNSGKSHKVLVETLTEGGGRDVYEVSLPCVLGAGRGLNTPSYPTFPDVVKARKREVRVVKLDDLVKEFKFEKPESGTEIIHLELFAEKRTPKKIEGNSAEVAKEIVRVLREEAKII